MHIKRLSIIVASKYSLRQFPGYCSLLTDTLSVAQYTNQRNIYVCKCIYKLYRTPTYIFILVRYILVSLIQIYIYILTLYTYIHCYSDIHIQASKHTYKHVYLHLRRAYIHTQLTLDAHIK